jgi:hypothetical protein
LKTLEHSQRNKPGSRPLATHGRDIDERLP